MAVSPEYHAWCRRSGIRQYGIEAAFVEHGWRGVVATQQINPGDTILEVPEHLLMTSRTAARDPLLGPLLMQQSLAPEQVLGCHLLAELSKCRGPQPGAKPAGSPWQIYLDQLPRSYSTFCNWTPEDVEALQAPHAQKAAEEAVAKIRDQWQEVLPVIKQLGLPKKFQALSAWKWAASTLMSRTMYVPFDSAGCLTPFGDLHNYSPPPAPFTPDVLKDLAPHDAPQQGRAATGGPTGSTGARREGIPLDAADAPSAAAQVGSSSGGEATAVEAAAAGVLLQGLDLDDGLEEGAVAKPRRSEASPSSMSGQEGRAGQDSSPEQGTAAAAAADDDDDDERDAAGERRGAGSAHSGPSVGASTCGVDHGSRDCGGSTDDDGPAVTGGDGHYDEQAGLYRLVARQRYAPGEQVFLCYGQHTNLELLEHYGFLLDDNPHEQVPLPAELVEEQARVLRASGQGAAGLHTSALRPPREEPVLSVSDCFVHADGRPSWGLLQGLRTLTTPPHERRKCSHLLAAGDRVSVPGDIQAMEVLRAACLHHLHRMPTTLKDDQQLLERLTRARAAADAGWSDPPTQAGAAAADGQAAPDRAELEAMLAASPHLDLAVQWRACQKRILVKAVLSAESSIAELSKHLSKGKA